MKCPDDDVWIGLADGELPERAARTYREHAVRCAVCGEKWQSTQALVSRLQAPRGDVDLDAFVGRLLERVEEPPARARVVTLPGRWVGLSAAAAVLLGVAALVLVLGQARRTEVALGPTPSSELVARGSQTHEPLRLVGASVYTLEGDEGARPLAEGALVRVGTAYTVGYRNRGTEPVYLLVFAVDAQDVVHWLYPGYLDAREDPGAVRLEPTEVERLLPDSVILEAPARGALRIFTLTSRNPHRVSAIERLAPATLTPSLLAARFAGTRVEVLNLRIE